MEMENILDFVFTKIFNRKISGPVMSRTLVVRPQKNNYFFGASSLEKNGNCFDKLLNRKLSGPVLSPDSRITPTTTGARSAQTRVSKE